LGATGHWPVSSNYCGFVATSGTLRSEFVFEHNIFNRLLTVRFLTIVPFDFRLEIANLTINVEPKTGRTAEFEHFASRTPIVFGAISANQTEINESS
jgi:hypothetical protein